MSQRTKFFEEATWTAAVMGRGYVGDLRYERIAESATAVFDTRGVNRRLGLASDDLDTL